MFCLPGICALIVFLLVRPQEAFEPLQRIPFLYLFLAASIGGLVLDLKLRRLEPVAPPTFVWAVLLILWIVLCDAIVAPDMFIPNMIDIAIRATIFFTLAVGIQRFRSFQVVAATVMTACLFLSVVCWHQGLQERSCVVVDPNAPGEGTPKDKPCQMANDCYDDDGEPGDEYRCEKVGMLGTYSIEDRVRYRGELHDPNELAMTICIGGLCFAIAFAIRRRDGIGLALGIFATLLVFSTVVMTKSRGGMIVLLAVPGVYAVRRWGVKALIVGGILALPLLALGGRGGGAAEESTFRRYEAWAAGLDMFRHSPLFGVGHRMFAQNHFMAAHNSYVLTLAELGLPGMFLFVTLIYMSLKTVFRGVVELAAEPGAQIAGTWGLAMLASLLGLAFQINTLSFAYHTVLWIFLVLAGGYASCVRHHKPGFRVEYGARDFLLISGACVAYAFVVLPLFLKWKHAM